MTLNVVERQARVDVLDKHRQAALVNTGFDHSIIDLFQFYKMNE
jgi:hypothetical protein